MPGRPVPVTDAGPLPAVAPATYGGVGLRPEQDAVAAGAHPAVPTLLADPREATVRPAVGGGLQVRAAAFPHAAEAPRRMSVAAPAVRHPQPACALHWSALAFPLSVSDPPLPACDRTMMHAWDRHAPILREVHRRLVAGGFPHHHPRPLVAHSGASHLAADPGERREEGGAARPAPAGARLPAAALSQCFAPHRRIGGATPSGPPIPVVVAARYEDAPRWVDGRSGRSTPRAATVRCAGPAVLYPVVAGASRCPRDGVGQAAVRPILYPVVAGASCRRGQTRRLVGPALS